MGLRFAILKTIGKGGEAVVLEYNENQLCERLKRRVRENFLKKRRFASFFMLNKIDEAIKVSFDELVTEFKEETVKIS